jgi:membrane protein YqaA with SNARE-associated domain
MVTYNSSLMDWGQVIFSQIDPFYQSIISSQFFINFGLFALFLVSAIPQILTITNEIIFVPLLDAGIHPFFIVVVAGLGAVLGDFIEYNIGRGINILRGNKGSENANHLLHKYRLPIFLVTPFLLIIGDIVLIIAGHERIGFKKIFPIVLVSQLLKKSLVMLIVLELVKLPNFLNF